MSFQHVKCDNCGGVIGIYDRVGFVCEKCGKQFDLHRLEYDNVMINDKTGWVFPILYIEVGELKHDFM